MWKLVTYVTCVVILFPNAYGYLDYTSYLLTSLTEHINQVNQLVKMIYKHRHSPSQSDSDPSELDGLEYDYLYDHALRQIINTLKNSYRIMIKLKSKKTSSEHSDIMKIQDSIQPKAHYDLDHAKKFKSSGRRNANAPKDWSNNFYESLASAFKKFLSNNPNVRAQLGEDFNADALINPPEPEKH